MKDNNRRPYPNTPTAAERKRQNLRKAAEVAQAAILIAATLAVFLILFLIIEC